VTLLELAVMAELGDDVGTTDQRRVQKAMLSAAPVVGFIVLWAVLLQERGGESFTIEDFAVAGFDSRATCYRRLKDFRRLFPAEHDPERFARALLKVAEKRGEPLTSPVLAIAV
jgi:hypothetical protein